MKKTIRTLAKQVIPKAILLKAWNTYCIWKARRAQQIFNHAPTEPQWLGWAELDQLQKKYPLERLEYTYEQPKLEARAQERIQEMLRGVPSNQRSKLRHFLDLGAWDGTICQQLQTMGKQTVGIDIRSEGFTTKAKQSGAAFQQMDIDYLGFAANSFDFVFSYNSFEHFPHPDKALFEAIRVTRPGGFIYLNFGPIWLAPKGAHQFKTISVPYNQCLFTKELLEEYAAAHKFELMGFFWMNEWLLGQYRQLWQDVSPYIKPVFYYEERTADYVELIEQYPSCFKSKSTLFDDFLVSYIEVLFQKNPAL